MALFLQGKIEKEGKIIGAVVYDTVSGNKFNIKKQDLKRYIYSNAKITSDNRILTDTRLPVINIGSLTTKSSTLTLYHGSYNKVVKPVFGGGCDKHDYGRGFYLTENIELAKEWAVCTGNDIGYVHCYELDLSGLNILDFNKESELAWLAELMSHRDADNSARYRRLSVEFIRKFKKDTSEYDVIYGWRADSSYFSIAKRFVRDEIDYTLIGELFRLGDLENQVCLKSRKAFTNLRPIGKPILANSYYKEKYGQRDLLARKKMNELIDSDRNTMTKGFSYAIREM